MDIALYNARRILGRKKFKLEDVARERVFIR